MKGHLTFADTGRHAAANGNSVAAVAEPIDNETYVAEVEQPRPHLRVAELPGWQHTLVLTGRLDHSTADELDDEIECLCQEGVTTVMLDLSGLDTIDFAGVQVITSRLKLCKERGRDLSLVSGTEDIRRVFAEAGADGMLSRETVNGKEAGFKPDTGGIRRERATSTVKTF